MLQKVKHNPKRPVATEGQFRAVPLQFFCSPLILLCREIFILKHTTKTKIFPTKNFILPTEILKPGYGPKPKYTSLCVFERDHSEMEV